MSTTDLQQKAITVQGGKQYVLVSDRILYFNEKYPNGTIQTELLSAPESDRIVCKATIIPDIDKPSRTFTGHSQATVGQGMVNKTAALENAETSAIGRALGIMGIGVIDSIASHDEMVKAQVFTPQTRQETPEDFVYEQTEQNTDQEAIAAPQGASHFCTLHQKELKERTSQNGGTYYDHRRKNDNGQWERCDGKGWKA